MTQLTMEREGRISLPKDLCERYGFSPETAIRVVESRSGVLLVPLKGSGMSPELQREIGEWQSLAAEGWDLFPYEVDDE